MKKDFIKVKDDIFKREAIDRIELREDTVLVYINDGKPPFQVKYETKEEAKKVYEDAYADLNSLL